MPERYVRFGKVYRRFRELINQVECGRSICEIQNDAHGQMRFATTFLHERAGANPNFAKYHRDAIEAVLATSSRTFECCVADDKDFPDAVWHEFKTRCGKPNENLTFGPVAGTLRLLSQSQIPTWSTLLATMTPVQAWQRLDGLKGVGPKLASFMLREFQAFFSVWTEPPRNCWFCFMPVDRWVLRVAQWLWRGEDWSSESLASAKEYEVLAQRISERFPTNDAAMDFNMARGF